MERPKSGRVDFQRATVDLVAFHRLEQGTEVSFAEALAVVALALDELEEHRAKQRLGEYLQQQAGLAAFGRAVEQNAARLQLGYGLAMAGQALFQVCVIDVVGGGQQRDTGHLHAVERIE